MQIGTRIELFCINLLVNEVFILIKECHTLLYDFLVSGRYLFCRANKSKVCRFPRFVLSPYLPKYCFDFESWYLVL